MTFPQPSSRKCSTKADPIKPAAPVTMILSDLFKFFAFAGVQLSAAGRGARLVSGTRSSRCGARARANIQANRALWFQTVSQEPAPYGYGTWSYRAPADRRRSAAG